MTCSLTKTEEEFYADAESEIKKIIDCSENENEAIHNINLSGQGLYCNLDCNARTGAFSFFVKLIFSGEKSRKIKVMKNFKK